jgi:insertion element IS1 protein InsB
MIVSLGRVESAELDEMWSFVQSKKQQRWLWHAIAHATGKVLAYVLTSDEDVAFLELKVLLKRFGITQFFTLWHLEQQSYIIGKYNTQKIEHKHLTLRTMVKRLARKTICFSKSVEMHDLVIGLFINYYKFGLPI